MFSLPNMERLFVWHILYMRLYYVVVDKHVSSLQSIIIQQSLHSIFSFHNHSIESPSTPRKPHANTISFDTHSEAEAEIAKLRAMTLSGPVSNNSPSAASTRHHQVAKTKSYEYRNNSKTTSSPRDRDQTDGNVFTYSAAPNSPTKSKATRQVIDKPPSITTPDFVELEVSASNVRESISDLRKDLHSLRKLHLDNTRNFRNDIQKKLLEFRKKASKVDDILQSKIDQNNNNIFCKYCEIKIPRNAILPQKTRKIVMQKINLYK